MATQLHTIWNIIEKNRMKMAEYAASHPCSEEYTRRMQDEFTNLLRQKERDAKLKVAK